MQEEAGGSEMSDSMQLRGSGDAELKLRMCFILSAYCERYREHT